MIHGCQRKVIFIRNTESKLFEEAYFILRNDTASATASGGDMIKEANRIISAFSVQNAAKSGGSQHGAVKSGTPGAFRSPLPAKQRSAALFVSGSAVGCALFWLISYIFI